MPPDARRTLMRLIGAMLTPSLPRLSRNTWAASLEAGDCDGSPEPDGDSWCARRRRNGLHRVQSVFVEQLRRGRAVQRGAAVGDGLEAGDRVLELAAVELAV